MEYFFNVKCFFKLEQLSQRNEKKYSRCVTCIISARHRDYFQVSDVLNHCVECAFALRANFWKDPGFHSPTKAWRDQLVKGLKNSSFHFSFFSLKNFVRFLSLFQIKIHFIYLEKSLYKWRSIFTYFSFKPFNENSII
jgi:hypothetical protein